MFKKFISIVLCAVMVLSLFPGISMASTSSSTDVTQVLPINNGMESVANIRVDNGSSTLTQDRMSGKYAAKIAAGEVSGQNYVEYTLTTSDEFEINQYSKINLWVKPGNGASWIEFYTGTDGKILMINPGTGNSKSAQTL